MTERSYHHGHLRATLLADAERTLREQGIDQLSLRELARQAGVSHAAPRRHFADRQALLDALAEAGWARLSDEARAAMEEAGDDYRARLRAVGTAQVRFATRDAALVELMFAGSGTRPSGVPPEGSLRLFAMVGDLIRQGQQDGRLPPGDPERLRLLLMALARGISVLVTAGSVEPGQADGLIDDAVGLLTAPGISPRPRPAGRRAPTPSLVGAAGLDEQGSCGAVGEPRPGTGREEPGRGLGGREAGFAAGGSGD